MKLEVTKQQARKLLRLLNAASVTDPDMAALYEKLQKLLED